MARRPTKLGETYREARAVAREIVDRYHAGETQKTLAAEYGIDRTYVSMLVNGKRLWPGSSEARKGPYRCRIVEPISLTKTA